MSVLSIRSQNRVVSLRAAIVLFTLLLGGMSGLDGRAYAQTRAASDSNAQTSSSLAGTVVDSSGGVIQGARITVRRDGEIVGEVRSSSDGSSLDSR